MAAILNSANLHSAILVFSSNSSCQDWFPLFAQKNLDTSLNLPWQSFEFCHFDSSNLPQKKLHSFILTQTWWWQPSWILPSWIDTAILRHLVIFSSDSLKNTLFPLWPWFKLIQSDSNSFILTKLDGSHHEAILNSIFDSILVCPLKLTHFAQKNFTHSFWLNLMMAAILNSAMLDWFSRHLVIFSQIHSKNFSLHSDSDSN